MLFYSQDDLLILFFLPSTAMSWISRRGALRDITYRECINIISIHVSLPRPIMLLVAHTQYTKAITLLYIFNRLLFVWKNTLFSVYISVLRQDQVFAHPKKPLNTSLTIEKIDKQLSARWFVYLFLFHLNSVLIYSFARCLWVQTASSVSKRP